jgi:hypothetical protein
MLLVLLVNYALASMGPPLPAVPTPGMVLQVVAMYGALFVYLGRRVILKRRARAEEALAESAGVA